MKKIFRIHFKKIMLALMLIFALTFSACTYSNEPSESEGGVSYIGNIDGFKATYRPESYPVEDYYSNFSQDILSELTKIFGQADLEIDLQDYLIYFLDDIRSSVYLADEETNMFNATLSLKWKWTLGEPADFSYPLSQYKVYFDGTSNTTDTADAVFQVVNNSTRKSVREMFYFGTQSEQGYYVGKYAESLQVVILEILLGRTPTEFTYNISSNTITPSASSLLPTLQSDYEKYTTYIGISKETDIPKITDYILDKVIGSQKFSENNSSNYFSREEYKSIIDEYIWENYLSEYYFADTNGQNEDLGSIYNVYPTNLIKDYEANSFFISSTDGECFSHIPSGEYQSLVMMPTEDNYLYEMWYFLVADRVLDIDVYYRYYDSATNSFHQSTPVTVQTQIESSFDESKAQILSINFYDNNDDETLFLTKQFNQEIGNGILKAENTKYMNYSINQYYKAMPSINGFGTVSVLDETAFINDNSSFFEMVFDVHKDSENLLADYSFKVGMYSLFFASQNQINDYLLQNNN